MFTDFKSALRPALTMTLLFALLLGIAYPLALTGIDEFDAALGDSFDGAYTALPSNTALGARAAELRLGLARALQAEVRPAMAHERGADGQLLDTKF